jgi:hypothetical protein
VIPVECDLGVREVLLLELPDRLGAVGDKLDAFELVGSGPKVLARSAAWQGSVQPV